MKNNHVISYEKGIWTINIFKIYEGYYGYNITRRNEKWLSGAYKSANNKSALTEAIKKLEDYVWNGI